MVWCDQSGEKKEKVSFSVWPILRFYFVRSLGTSLIISYFLIFSLFSNLQNQPQGKGKKNKKKAAPLPWDCGLGILFLDETTVNSDRDISDEEDEEEDQGILANSTLIFKLSDVSLLSCRFSYFFSSRNRTVA
jgi:hypothetical protein